MKRYEWEFPVAPERLQLQLREVTHEVPRDRMFAVRGALLGRIQSTQSPEGDCCSNIGPLATIHPRGNA
jgi:hypothetical protein